MRMAEPCVERAIEKKKVTISNNKAGRQAFMNNAPVDNFGTKEYHNCIFGTVRIKPDWPSITPTNSGPRSTVVLAKPLSSSSRTQKPIAPIGKSVQLYTNTGRKSGNASMKLCPELGSNWISGEVVRRCKLRPVRRQTAKEANYKGKILTSTGELVQFICPGEGCSHRFHIVEDALLQFEMLCGVEFMGQAKGEEESA
ncbi:hypothetical protein T440DRAFT_557469 [Plenodomus tracheiphilus IPT5]|uniref:Uncharacterized protein n=1 Tax=Plenodomus tracheiphilus IPT5 TaxID=1408161 RepID=A0A6A7AW91_9PLEO|nr:hypothetical protein T440DRAFT_557469 [Plenodomus tracheiphilus IPT5]